MVVRWTEMKEQHKTTCCSKLNRVHVALTVLESTLILLREMRSTRMVNLKDTELRHSCLKGKWLASQITAGLGRLQTEIGLCTLGVCRRTRRRAAAVGGLQLHHQTLGCRQLVVAG